MQRLPLAGWAFFFWRNMTAGSVQMGPNAVSDPSQLMSALQSQQPPSNPSTLAERTNPDQQALEHIKAAQVSIDRAKAFTNDPAMLQVFDIVAGVLTKALLKFDGTQVVQSLQESVASLPPPVVPAAGGQPMGGPPQMGAPAAPGSPQGAPGPL